jgi:hypothetical protein
MVVKMEFSSKPHKKKLLTTKFGRTVDAISYKTLFRISLYIWLGSSVYFCFATFSGHGMNTMQGSYYWCESFLTALYFSGVTLTTLGYGDISPVGFGRAVALFLAFTGVTVFTIFVGKISSERQSSILLLLHTSDIERRLSAFSENLNKLKNEIFICNAHDTESIYLGLKSANSLVESISRYVHFHFNQTFFIELGTSTTINRLLVTFYDLQKTLIDNKQYGVSEARIESAIVNLSNKLQKMETALEYFTQEKQQVNIVVGKDLRNNHASLKKWYSSQLTESLKFKVIKKFGDIPRKSWPRHPHKILASEFGVSNKLASECITELTEKRRL